MFYGNGTEKAILLAGNLLAAGALFLWIWFRKAKFPKGLKAPILCIMEAAVYAMNLTVMTEMIMGGIELPEFQDPGLWVAGFLFWEGMLWLFFSWRAITLASSPEDCAGEEYSSTRRDGEKKDGLQKKIWEEWEYGLVLLLLLVQAVLYEWAGTNENSSHPARFVAAFLSLGVFLLLLCIRSLRQKAMPTSASSRKDAALQRQRSYQQSVELQYQRTRELWHDLKNHIHVLELLAGEGRLAELNDYLGSFKRDVEIRMIPMKTGCMAVDALLSDKLYHARRSEMEILLQVCDLSKCMVRSSDLCAVLGNLLDNAMEACARLPENRRIQLKIKNQENFYYITVVNTAAQPQTAGCDPVSEKRGKENGVGHGLGLRSVERIAHQYGGSLVTDYKDGEFRAIVRMEGQYSGK